MAEGSKVIRSQEFCWSAVPLKAYKEEGGTHRGVTRQTLMGEGAGEEALAFLTRYFEVEPGGHTTLELHGHPHAVVVLCGRGHVVLGDATHEIAPHDCVYVAPGTVHQFRAAADAPLGFLCMVDRVRDRATPAAGIRPPDVGR